MIAPRQPTPKQIFAAELKRHRDRLTERYAFDTLTGCNALICHYLNTVHIIKSDNGYTPAIRQAKKRP